MKIAVSSTDGKNIDTHFGKAKSFFVFEFANNQLSLVEQRSTGNYCSDLPKHAFRKDEFQRVYEVIKDCQVLYTLKIGDVPAEKFRSLGMEVRQCEGLISKAIAG